jgi:methyltransferase (TIGR00027 family)
MKTNTSSKTAQYMALFRAMETSLPRSRKLFNDPFAVTFLDTKLRCLTAVSRVPLLNRYISVLIHKRAPGALSSGIARTKYIDDLLADSVLHGTRQVIILGAGFDTRGLRLDFLKDVKVIEIDHPDTSNFKRARLHKHVKKFPVNILFYQADFNKQSLDEVAAHSKIDFNVPTTLIWEGVTNYLTRTSIDATFRFTRNLTRDFNIIFTYIEKAVLDSPAGYEGAEKVRDILKHNEENWTFGFNPEELPGYLSRYDLKIIEDVNAAEYRKKYMPERREINSGYEFYRVASAKRS